MGDRRKLNAEIERCLRKVTEGVEAFDDTWQKVHSAPNHNQKDKYEQELKKEIKKLQRLRDQIKTWIQSSEIKDKKQLQEARKNIEQQMERFKVVERETKTKAYSKEGLGAGQKLDPQEKEKEECTHWIREALQELQIQLDKFEADIEALSVSLKKKKSDRDKQERLEDTKGSLERHKFHIETLEKILRGIDNDAIDLKPIHNLKDEVEYYVESNQESDFKENELMYEEIDLENLTTIMAPVIAIPATTTTGSLSHSSSLSNGTSSSLTSHSTTLMDISSSTFNIHSHSLPNHSNERPIISSHHTDNDSNAGLTTPSSTQPSSPSASPALSATEDRKRNKSESEDNQSQGNRSNSGANGSSTTSNSHASSPKNPLQHQQSPNVPTATKTPVVAASNAPTSAQFTYPTSTQPVLQYSTIVSQNSSSSTTPPTNNSSTTSKQMTIQSPQSRPLPRQTSVTNSESTVNTPSPQSIPTASNDRLLNQQIFNNISQISGSSLNPTASTLILANGATMPSSSYSGPGSALPTSNIPLQISPSTSLDPLTNTQQSPLLSHTLSSETERVLNPSTSLLTNGSLDGHSSLDVNTDFPNLLSTASGFPLPSSSSSTNPASSFLSTDLSSTNTGGIIGQLSEHHTLRYPLPTSNQPSIQANRVPLTAAETRMLNRLTSAYAKLPSLLESERQRTNANRIYGRNPLGHVPMISYYPQTPPTGSDTPEFYYRLAPDTLFFVFYYMEGTRAQYLAAKALKRQSWRFHTKHMMWFQRHEEPKTITDDYEQGTYIFFDYERWQTRKRDNFMFEYKFLEDREF